MGSIWHVKIFKTRNLTSNSTFELSPVLISSKKHCSSFSFNSKVNSVAKIEPIRTQRFFILNYLIRLTNQGCKQRNQGSKNTKKVQNVIKELIFVRKCFLFYIFIFQLLKNIFSKIFFRFQIWRKIFEKKYFLKKCFGRENLEKYLKEIEKLRVEMIES